MGAFLTCFRVTFSASTPLRTQRGRISLECLRRASGQILHRSFTGATASQNTVKHCEMFTEKSQKKFKKPNQQIQTNKDLLQPFEGVTSGK